jgi:hypothetical protein
MKKQAASKKKTDKRILREKPTVQKSSRTKRTKTRGKTKNSIKNSAKNKNVSKRQTSKKTRKRRKSSGLKERNAHYIKQGMQQAVYVVTIFLTLFILSLSFLLYQWKDYKIVEYGKDIQRYKANILRLKSEVSRQQAQINSEYIKYHRIAGIAGEKLGLKPSVQEPTIFKVDKNTLQYYVEKDQKVEE